VSENLKDRLVFSFLDFQENGNTHAFLSRMRRRNVLRLRYQEIQL